MEQANKVECEKSSFWISALINLCLTSAKAILLFKTILLRFFQHQTMKVVFTISTFYTETDSKKGFLICLKITVFPLTIICFAGGLIVGAVTIKHRQISINVIDPELGVAQ